MPLVVMLHGCRQDPDDFAAGTRMNDLADAAGWIVLYPGQDRRFNHLGCWNWFHEGDQQRGRGEPSLIADMTRHVMATLPVDPQRVYVAGLSAGGAMAAIMATTYPELFAAVGVHSGLPHAAARDLASALRAMRHGPGSRAATRSAGRRTVPTIVFHGDEDTTVHPCNGEELIARARWTASSETAQGASDLAVAEAVVEHGQVLGGRAFSRTLHRDAQGRCDAEHWVIHGAGHAWSGGSASGSFADPLGPDASREMLRFFLEHPHPERGTHDG
jgi:poly(hydroxyalkanoate) depolymerase family esterase